MTDTTETRPAANLLPPTTRSDVTPDVEALTAVREVPRQEKPVTDISTKVIGRLIARSIEVSTLNPAIEGPCWELQGYRDKAGYGRVKAPRFGELKEITRCAHRASYEAFVGPIPDGLPLDHLCWNTACWRPDHLDPVPQRLNLARSRNHVATNMILTHCRRGHELTEANTYRSKQRPQVRDCRTCRREASRRAAAKAAAE